MWNIQLQTLWKNIEKSQKFLPAIPGRHVIMENGSWVELDSATWKPKRPIHLVLLNDHLLIASKKRKRMQIQMFLNKVLRPPSWWLKNAGPFKISTSLTCQPLLPLAHHKLKSVLSLPLSPFAAGTRSLTYRSEKRDPQAKQELSVSLPQSCGRSSQSEQD